jgi:hypothetical protein
MIARIKKVFKNWRADRQQLRELTIKLNALTDPTFLDRATATGVNIVQYMGDKMAKDLRNYKG